MVHSAELVAELKALRQRRQIRAFSGDALLPRDKLTAYAIANELVAGSGAMPAAWKLGATSAATQKAFDTDVAYYGAVLPDEVWQAGDAAPVNDLPEFKGEAEIALRLAPDFDRARLSDTPPETWFDTFAPALECPWSVVADLPQAGLPALLMDRCAVGLLLLGNPLPLPASFAAMHLSTVQDGVELASGTVGRDLVIDPVTAAVSIVREIAAQGPMLQPGQYISTGGVTPCVTLDPTKQVVLRLDGVEMFSFAFRKPA